MNSSTTAEFRRLLEHLPDAAQHQARETFRLWLANPRHPSLHFKRIGDYWTVRVGIHYRAVARMRNDTIVWFWIGTHAEYDRLLRGC